MWSKSVELLNPYEAVKAAAPVTKWRKKHRRCEFCIHLRYKEPPPNCLATGFFCKAKKNYDMDPILPRPFCRLFQVRED